VGIAAKLTIEDAEELTRAPRTAVDAYGTIRGSDAHSFDTVVRNLSQTGCLVESGAQLKIGAVVILRMAAGWQTSARIVRRDGSHYGCEFVTPLSRDELDASRDQDKLNQAVPGRRPSPRRIVLLAATAAVAVALSWPGSERPIGNFIHWLR